jgi:hypothetical protein
VSLLWSIVAPHAVRRNLVTPDDAAWPGIGPIAGQQYVWFDPGLPFRAARYSRTQ